jgi:hypothetical protein
MSDPRELPEEDPNQGQRRSVVGLPAARERTIGILSECFARNLLEMEEFERRVSLAHQAGSVKDLARLIDDVPGDLAEAADRPPDPATGRMLALREDEQTFHGIMMTRRLRGQWLKCRTVNTRTLMSSVEFDFRDLELPAGVVEIEVLAVMSSVVVTVPPELPVQTEVVPILGEVKEGRLVKTNLAGKGPGIRITGFAVMSEIKVRSR